jgi:hypothetical protein
MATVGRDADEAVAGIAGGSTVLIGGFGDRNDLAERLKIIFQQA